MSRAATKPLVISCRFEPTRLSPTRLRDVYARLLPVRKRSLPMLTKPMLPIPAPSKKGQIG